MVETTAATIIAIQLSAIALYDSINPTPNGTKQRAITESRNFAAGRTVSGLKSLSFSAANMSNMPITLPEI